MRPEAIGFADAERLEAVLDAGGEDGPTATVIVPPGKIVTRGSSDAVAVREPCVAQALRYIQEHALEAVSVDDIARGADAVGAARRRRPIAIL